MLFAWGIEEGTGQTTTRSRGELYRLEWTLELSLYFSLRGQNSLAHVFQAGSI